MNDSTPRRMIVAARMAALVTLSLLALFLILSSLNRLYSDLTLRMGGFTQYTLRSVLFLAVGAGLAWWTCARGWKRMRKAP